MAKYDLEKHTRTIFPWFWQNETNLSLIDVIVAGLFTTVNDSYGDAEIDYTQKVGYSIQRLSLESSLNDRFDSTLRRITVQNGATIDAGYLFNEDETIPDELEEFVFNEAESLPVGIDDFYVRNEGESGSGTIEPFVVNCPVAITADEEKISAWVDFVKITGTEYVITFT